MTNNIDRATDDTIMTPRIVRTRKELGALDPDTIVQRPPQHTGRKWSSAVHADELLYLVSRWGRQDNLPAAVIATGDQVRAARKALEELS